MEYIKEHPREGFQSLRQHTTVIPSHRPKTSDEAEKEQFLNVLGCPLLSRRKVVVVISL